MRYSTIVAGNPVPFPAFTGERIYMQVFEDGQLPVGLERWQPTVDAMLNGRRSRAYLMVDQRVVHQNAHHRRPGLHIDGVWAIDRHGVGHQGRPSPIRHGGHGSGGYISAHGHRSYGSQTIILASDAIGCKAYEGWWDPVGEFNGGDCSYVDTGGMDQVIMAPRVAYYGDAMQMLHESIPAMATGPRTVVRLNVEN